MRLVKSTNSAPELVVRSLTHCLGFRFRLHDSRLPGCPDLVFPSRKKVVFVHGCFWHRHNRCNLARVPKSRIDFWLPKLEGNKVRDAVIRRALTRIGWSSMVVWECELHDSVRVMFRLLAFLEE